MVALKGDDWELAPSLVQLFEEVDARWPKRRKTSDGTIGDKAHAARSSEHNPDDDPDPMPEGMVSAADITRQSEAMVATLMDALTGTTDGKGDGDPDKADPRVWYVIHRGVIRSRTHDFRAQKYTGTNPHEGHLHVSLMQTRAATKATSWGLNPGAVPQEPSEPDSPKPDNEPLSGPRTVQRGDRGELVKVLQRFLDVHPDSGHFGPLTAAQVRRYQRAHGLVDDGIVGPKTWAVIRTALRVPKAIW